ncbi:MAG: class I tRNA ligase family protein [Pseudonocardiaceae bacterium]
MTLWREQDIFARSVEQTVGGPEWVFYEGPPTANGRPGTHHVEARVFKDIFPRFKTMKGFHVPRRGGWDCHGLPVEIAVEKELGLSGKQDIEKVGIEEFNDKGLLVQDHRVAPYCPRCGTGLSDHEVAQGYESIVDPSVYVRLPIISELVISELEGLTGVDLLVWKTTPWALGRQHRGRRASRCYLCGGAHTAGHIRSR